MTSETSFRIAFIILLVLLLAMRTFYMIKLKLSGGRLMPDEKATAREGGRGFLFFRMVLFIALLVFLGMYIAGMAWIGIFRFGLPDWLRWAGFALGLLSVAFMTWTQVTLDTQWSAQLQLRQDHQLITSGPYASMRHPLYTSVLGWGVSLSLLTANWIFVAVSVLAVGGLLYRIPKEEQMMLEAFGDAYRSYQQRTGRYFPKFRK
jgi:protein-S-isoprenylcysteine O-methyltransferase Ste14